MKPIILLGIILIVIGIVALAYHGVTYTSREKVFEIGRLEGIKKTEKTIPLPPLLGGAMLGGGILLVIIGTKK